MEFWTATTGFTIVLSNCAPRIAGFNRNVGDCSREVDARRAHLKFAGMKNTFLAFSSAGPNRDSSKDTRQQSFWDEHAAFIDQLVDDGFILMGGPLVDEGGSLLIINAEDENEVRETLKNDPWMQHGILKLESIKRWQIFIDARK